jgi:hypothetical protein
MSDYPALEELLDKALAKYLDPRLHRWTYVPAAADRGDLASDLADAARQHFTGRAIEKLNEDRGADPRVRICTGAAQLAEWASARISARAGQVTDVSTTDEVGRELIEEVHEALGTLFAAGYAAMGEPTAEVGADLTDEDKADPLTAVARHVSEIALQASYLRHTVGVTDLPHVQAIQAGAGRADSLVEALLAMRGDYVQVAADPPLWETARQAMIEVLRSVRVLTVEDLARLDLTRVGDVRKAMEWLEDLPSSVWPPPSFDDEEPF